MANNGYPRDEKKPLGDEKRPYSYDDYILQDDDEYEGKMFKKTNGYPDEKRKQPAVHDSYPDDKKQPIGGFESYPDDKKAPMYPNENKAAYPDENKAAYPDEKKAPATFSDEKYAYQPFNEKSYPMGFDTYASTSHAPPPQRDFKAPVVVPEPEADEYFYPINNSSFASRNQSVDNVALTQPAAVERKRASLMSDELDRTFTDNESLNNLKKYDDIYDDMPHQPRRRSNRNSGRQHMPMPVPDTRSYYGRPDEQGGDMNEKHGQYGNSEPQEKSPETSPYVGRWALMSRAWATQTVIMLLLTAFSYYLLAQDANDMAQDAILQITSACLTLESATNSVINAPRSVAISTVTMVQSTAQAIIDLTGRSFLKIISILENLIVWILRMYLGTYICIAEVIIRTALSIASDVAKVLTEALNVAVNTVVSGLQSVAADIAGGIEKAGNEIVNFFTGGKEKNAIDFNIEDIRKTLTISIPTDWIDNIGGLADKIPTQDQIFGNIEQLLNVPFKLMTNALTSTFSNARVDLVNSTKFADEKFSDMCGVPMGQDTVNELAQATMWIMYIAAFAFLGAAVGLIIFELYNVNRQQNKFQVRLTEFRQELVEYEPPATKEEVEVTPPTRKEMDFFILPGRPWFQRVTNMITRKYGDTEHTSAWRWFLDYIWHPPAMACFLVGAMGLISIYVQISAIDGLRVVYIPKLAKDLNKFQDQFLGEALLGGVRNDSLILANSINGDIASSEVALDRTLFAPIDDGTTSLNNTLNEFVATYIGGIRSVFSGTPLQYPIEGLVNCTLTKNIQSVQKVLTFVNEFAGGITFPRVSENVLYDPVLSLMKPVNKSANALRTFAVGVYVPDADSLDPMSFPPDKDVKRSAASASLLSKYSSLHPGYRGESDSSDSLELVSSVQSGGDALLHAATDLANNPTLVPGAVLMRRDTPETWIPNLQLVDSLPIAKDDALLMTALGAGVANHPLAADATLPPPSAPLPPPTATTPLPSSSVTSELGPLSSESGGSSNVDPDASLTKYGTKPTSELTREEVSGAQRYDGYTGGLLNTLCDNYIARLKSRIPLMVALMATWIVIVILGLTNVARHYHRIKREARQTRRH
ncbi:plasma membrane fusion protein prm1 [Coemansia sp. RSA 922]|nr:plasma membrane fusion protein prm1 [Coemansia sp. S16]KAJ2109400.1 plasma membrane fusion protein prm1 [Coemansia sp. RSA 922]KAJ2347087.1 plasma membrane fusion protein prm1 [Coemansia sp. RSA 2673]